MSRTARREMMVVVSMCCIIPWLCACPITGLVSSSAAVRGMASKPLMMDLKDIVGVVMLVEAIVK